jgi:hypothetical protein
MQQRNITYRNSKIRLLQHSSRNPSHRRVPQILI